jgi:hypothetical protein
MLCKILKSHILVKNYKLICELPFFGLLIVKGGRSAILVHCSAAQRTNEMLADQRTGKNSGPAPADYRNRESAGPLLNYFREVI